MESQNEDDLNVDMAEVRKVLEDANMTEPNMTEELMISYYRALTNSKSTASEEDQTRRLNESQDELKQLFDEDVESVKIKDKPREKPFTPKSWTSENKLSLESALERNNNENVIEDNILEDVMNDSPRDATKTAFGFNEMAKDSEHTLNIITHELKFIPIQSSNKFLNTGTALKAKMLYAYHTKVNKMKTELARSSFYPAPLPKITSTTETFSSFSENDCPETYICRSGRQTKRKIYNYDDDDDSLDGINNKKLKNSDEQEWLNKPAQNKNSPRTHKKPEINKVSTEVNKTESEDTNKEKKIFPKKETRTPLSRKLSNLDIIKRSSIFGDTPKRRCEAMFDKLKEEEEKRQKEEKTIEAFNRTLEKLDEDHDDAPSNEDIITVDDEEFMKKRVIPQIPRKLINRKRNNPEGLTPLDIKVRSPSQKKEPTAELNENQDKDFVTKPFLKKRPAIRKAAISDSAESLPSTSRNSSKGTASNSVTCPICGGSFQEDKIEEHAATCGDDPAPHSSSISKVSRITCEVCDKVVDFDTNYELHVKNCISKKKDKD